MTIPSDTLPILPFYHIDQPDRPNTVFPSSAALKAAFDSSTIAVQGKHNDLIASLINAILGQSGAEYIGSAPVPNVTGATIWNQLVFMSSQIQAIVGGSIPPQSVITSMIANEAVTFIKLEKMLQTAAVAGQITAYKTLGGAL